MGQAFTQVDAFSDKPFAGNPAAVLLLAEPRDASWMQLVAREMNLSETAFLVRRDRGYDLRWFTPTIEMELCGHATLASAHVLWEQGHIAPDETATFHTLSGELKASKKGTWIEMNFPAAPVTPDSSVKFDLEAALGASTRFVGRSSLDHLVEVGSEGVVRSLDPDLTMIRRLPVRGLIVTSRAAGSEYDFVSRFFGPAVGINEDPATGSAHCTLGPYWRDRLGRDDLLGYQASARGAFIRTRCEGDRVLISGQAITVMRGELL